MAEYTPEQIKDLETRAGKVDELTQQLQGMVPKAELDQIKADLDKAKGEEKNWGKARGIIDKLVAVAKEKGVQVDAEGNIVSSGVNLDEVKNTAKEEGKNAAMQELINTRLEEELENFEADSRETIKHFYNKLTTGEKVGLRDVKKFVEQAANAANSNDRPVKRVNINGQPPRSGGSENNISEEKAKDLGGRMGLSFANSTDKK